MNETKQRIINEGLKLFKSKTYKEVTVNDICQVAKVSKHTFYYYFDSKEEIIVRAIFNSSLREEIYAQMAIMSDPLAKYKVFNQVIVSRMANIGYDLAKELLLIKLSKVMLEGDTTIVKNHQKHQKIEEIRIELLAQAQTKGLINNMDKPRELILYHDALTFGIIQMWCTGNGKIDLLATYSKATKSLFQEK